MITHGRNIGGGGGGIICAARLSCSSLWVGGLFARSHQQKIPRRHRVDLWAATTAFLAAENDDLQRAHSPGLLFPDGEGGRKAADKGEAGYDGAHLLEFAVAVGAAVRVDEPAGLELQT
jgi:hypothetical protein